MNSIGKRRLIAEENRGKILESAIRLFQEYGFENVTIDDIVKDANFSKGTFYKLFISKDDLVISYMIQWNALYEQYYHEELEHSDCSALDKMRLLIQYMLSASTRGGLEFQRVAISSSMRDSVLAEKMSKSNAEITAIFRNIILEGRSQGCITTRYTDEELVNTIYTIVEGTAFRWAVSRNGETIESMMGKSIEILIKAIQDESS